MDHLQQMRGDLLVEGDTSLEHILETMMMMMMMMKGINQHMCLLVAVT